MTTSLSLQTFQVQSSHDATSRSMLQYAVYHRRFVH